MQTIDISLLPALNSVDLSDVFEVYTMVDDQPQPQVISFSDLNSYFFSTESFSALSAKYEELKTLMSDFEQFVKTNYPSNSEVSNICATASDLTSTIDQLLTIEKAKSEFLADYATLDYAELKKNKELTYNESLASGFGSYRSSILNNVMEPE